MYTNQCINLMSLDLHQMPFKTKLNLKNKGRVAKLQISMSLNSAVKAAQVLIPRAKTEADRTVIHVCLPSVLQTKELRDAIAILQNSARHCSDCTGILNLIDDITYVYLTGNGLGWHHLHGFFLVKQYCTQLPGRLDLAVPALARILLRHILPILISGKNLSSTIICSGAYSARLCAAGRPGSP
jgi:hypothetical protein